LTGHALRYQFSTDGIINIKLDGVEIKEADSCRSIGVAIDNDLKWTNHNDDIVVS
jgi:hypothetical protein